MLGITQEWVLIMKLSHGFTLIELMIVVAVVAMLLVFGIPSMTAYAANAKVRHAAETFYSAVQLARAEAIRTNHTAVLALSGSTWSVTVNGVQVDSRPGSEAGSGSSVNVTGPATIEFNGLGNTNLSGKANVTFRHATFNPTCSLDEAVRCINVVVSTSGQSRLCEPGRSSNDPRAC